MKARKQSSTSYPILFFMTSSTDHVSGITGITPTVTISKNGGSFASPSGSVTELANGWYALAGNSTDRNTLGEFLLHATGTGCDPTDDRYTITSFDPFDATRLGATSLPNANAGSSGGLPLSVDSSGGVNTVQVSGTNQTAGDLYSYLTTNLGALGANLSAIPKTGFKLASDGLSQVSAWSVAITGNITGNLSGSVGSISSFGTLIADIWSYATRTLTAGTNISLAKGTGVTGFNDLDAASIRSAVGLALANLDTQLAALSSGQLTQANIRTAIGLAAANLDTQLATITSNEATINSNVNSVGASVLALGSPMQSGSSVTLATSQPNYAPAKASDIPSAGTNASAVRTELTTELGRIDAAISSISPLTAAGTRAALGLASANLDTQLTSLSNDIGTPLQVGDSNIAAIKAKTDQLTFTTANHVDATASTSETTVSVVIPAVVAAASTQANQMALVQGDTLRATITDLGDLNGISDLFFTVKRNLADTDASALIKISLNSGLEFFNGSVPLDSSDGSITIDDADAGDITIYLSEERSAEISITRTTNYAFDIRKKFTNSVSTPMVGSFIMSGAVTQTLS